MLVATGASPRPYTFFDESDELTGYDIEILKLIDEKLDDVDFEFEVAEFPALFAGLVDFNFAERVVFKGYGPDQSLDIEFIPLDSDYLVDTYGTKLYSAFAFSKRPTKARWWRK